VPDIIAELATYGIEVLVHDPTADPDEARAFYGVDLVPFEELKDLDALVAAVAHAFYKEQPLDKIVDKLIPGGCLMDVKSMFDPEEVAKMNVNFWRL
jgi:UDP-N-acetyl-D-galactosamine dehydrogenase